MCLNSHYRNQLVFTYEALDGAESAYKKLKNKVLSLVDEGTIDEEIYEKYNNEFMNLLRDDLNVANTITLIYDLLKSDLNDKMKIELIKSWEKVLSLGLFEKEDVNDEDKVWIEEQINKRNIAKQNKDFAEADRIRNELMDKGIILEDTREGTTFKKI